ncbi:hypothetical protein L1887_48062 [Cichorium endivia]|nr:hypothetical protein L1887_48062 [Cichorium endivia]
MQPGEHVYQLNAFGTKPYTLYQNSYLGYGLMQARMSINSLAAFTYSLAHPNAVLTGSAHDGAQGGFEWSTLKPDNTRIPSPCFTNGRTKAVLISQPGQRTQANVTMVGTDGGFAACRRLVEVMMDKDALQDQRARGRWRSARVRIRAPARRASARVRSKSSRTDPETCLDLSFMHGLLSLGYELEQSREISVAKKLGGTELGWCLGAQLAVLDEDGLICKA